MKTQGELAQALHVDAKTVGRWEAGHHRPRLRDLIAISAATGVDLDWLIGDDDSHTSTGRHTVRYAEQQQLPGLSAYLVRAA